MAAGNDLGRLLTQLRNVSSPLERMKLISRAWRSVKRLGPRERAVLARQIGFDEAEELIEGIAVSRGGLNPATVQRALDRLRDVKPGRLKQTLKDLQDPERRRELIDRGLDTATEMLAGPEAAEPPEAPRATEIAEDEAESAVPITPEAPAKRAAAPAAAAVAAAATKRPSAPAAGEPPARPAPPTKAVTQEPAPEKPPELLAPEPTPPPPRTERAQPAAEPVQPGPVEEPPLVPSKQARPAAPDSSELLRLVEGQATLFRRLRVLREKLPLGRGSSPERLRAILDLFPAGWSRRRVVQAMIEARVPDSVEEAVFLIEQLENRANRRWCARTLLHEWELSAGERELIASCPGAAPGPTRSA